MSRQAENQSRPSSNAAAALRWLLSGEWRPALLVGFVFAAYMLAQAGSVSGLATESKLATVIACLLIFGVFIGVVFVTEMKEVSVSLATRRQVATGCIACASIAFIVGAGFTGVALGALLGIVLGYTAPWWSKGI